MLNRGHGRPLALQPLSTLEDAADALSILTAAERFIGKRGCPETIVYEIGSAASS